ncbi:MAG: uroporphyrinogen decarboxylase family protein, partial [Phycisphaerae bacterium]|nr:uroporphyrinogen decarboxylase family protein [Phycisphaerae bacterium]
GWEAGLFLWYDHREKVEDVLEAWAEVFLEEIRLTVQHSPAPMITLGDNMDQLMVSPDLFRRYALPYYARVARIVHDAGKLLCVHWCGRTGRLLPLLPGSGVDVVEAVVTEPMSDLTIEGALAALDGRVCLQGGIPAVLMCREGGSPDDLRRRVDHIVSDLRPRRGFILGMSDNVPPNADFDRVRLISEIVNDSNA